jgi:hypothetical protein
LAQATKADLDGLVGIHPTSAEIFTTLSITKRSGDNAEVLCLTALCFGMSICNDGKHGLHGHDALHAWSLLICMQVYCIISACMLIVHR